MHDIRLIRDDPQGFDVRLARRGLSPMAGKILLVDGERREKITAAETAQAERNAASREIGRAKAAGDEARFERVRKLVADKKDEVARLEDEARQHDRHLTEMLLGIPNLPLDEVPEGADDSANVELRRWGRPPEFAFAPKQHYELGEAMGCMDFETAAKLSGSRFVILKGALARLHRSLAQFMIDTHVEENGLTEVWTPVLVRDKAMIGTGQLPKFGKDLFFSASDNARADIMEAALKQFQSLEDIQALAKGEDLHTVVARVLDRAETHEDFWLIPTAEVTLTNMVADQVLDVATLPRRYTAWTQCFRSEAGSAGKDTRGMLRQHQFEKVEMVSITRPEDSLDELERMTRCAEGILEKLGLPYRRVVLSTGDMGFSAQKTHDIEVWLPGQCAWREISSCSVCGDFQARRMNARFRREGGKPEFVHTLNGSGLAVGRTLIAVMENGQRQDGGIELPEALGPWLRGARRITPEGALE